MENSAKEIIETVLRRSLYALCSKYSYSYGYSLEEYLLCGSPCARSMSSTAVMAEVLPVLAVLALQNPKVLRVLAVSPVRIPEMFCLQAVSILLYYRVPIYSQ